LPNRFAKQRVVACPTTSVSPWSQLPLKTQPLIPKKLITLVDVGSGGTRLVMFMRQEDGKVQQCCRKECATENSALVKATTYGTSRYGAETNIDNVAEFSKALFEDARNSILNMTLDEKGKTMGANEPSRCPSLYAELKGKGADHWHDIVKKSGEIRCLATAGARITAVSLAGKQADKFANDLVGGFKKMLRDQAGPYKMTADSNLVAGAILDGTYESYFGMINGFRTAKAENVDFDAKKAIYFEVGGASQQIGWHIDAEADTETTTNDDTEADTETTTTTTGPTAADCIVHSAKTSVACSVQKKCTEGDGKGLKKILAKPLCKAAGCRMPDNVCVPPVAASTARFARQKTMLRSAKGPMDMAYPVKDVAGYDSATTAAEIAHKHAYAASILGTGTDRFTVHLLRHAIRKHVKESDPNVAYCPCLPSQKPNEEGQELTEDQYTTIKKVGETIQQTGMVFKGADNSVPNGVSDAAKDPEIQAWLSANTDRKIVGKKENYHECTRFIKKMFRDPVEVDDVGGTPKRTFHESFEIYQTELKKGNLFEAPGTIVYNSNALTGSGDHGVNNKPCGKEVSWEDLRKYTETSCEAKVDDTTNKFAFPNCAAASQAMVFIQELFGAEHQKIDGEGPDDFPHRFLSQTQKDTLKILPIAASWTPVAAEYVLDQQQFQTGEVKTWRPFKADSTATSEDTQWADTW